MSGLLALYGARLRGRAKWILTLVKVGSCLPKFTSRPLALLTIPELGPKLRICQRPRRCRFRVRSGLPEAPPSEAAISVGRSLGQRRCRSSAEGGGTLRGSSLLPSISSGRATPAAYCTKRWHRIRQRQHREARVLVLPGALETRLGGIRALAVFVAGPVAMDVDVLGVDSSRPAARRRAARPPAIAPRRPIRRSNAPRVVPRRPRGPPPRRPGADRRPPPCAPCRRCRRRRRTPARPPPARTSGSSPPRGRSAPRGAAPGGRSRAGCPPACRRQHRWRCCRPAARGGARRRGHRRASRRGRDRSSAAPCSAGAESAGPWSGTVRSHGRVQWTRAPRPLP